MSKEGIAAELSNIEEAVGRIRGMLQAPLSRSASTVSSASSSSSNSTRRPTGGPGRNNNGVESVNWNNEFGNMFEPTNKEVEKYMGNQKRNKTKRNKLNNATRKALNNQDKLMVKAGLAPPPLNNAAALREAEIKWRSNFVAAEAKRTGKWMHPNSYYIPPPPWAPQPKVTVTMGKAVPAVPGKPYVDTSFPNFYANPTKPKRTLHFFLHTQMDQYYAPLMGPRLHKYYVDLSEPDYPVYSSDGVGHYIGEGHIERSGLDESSKPKTIDMSIYDVDDTKHVPANHEIFEYIRDKSKDNYDDYEYDETTGKMVLDLSPELVETADMGDKIILISAHGYAFDVPTATKTLSMRDWIKLGRKGQNNWRRVHVKSLSPKMKGKYLGRFIHDTGTFQKVPMPALTRTLTTEERAEYLA
jgi:hypothetical protein